MTDLCIVFGCAAASAAFEESNFVLSLCLFTFASSAFSFVKRQYAGFGYVSAAFACALFHYLYMAYGVQVALCFAFFAVAAAAAGKGGAEGAGRILFFASLPLLAVMPFFAGDTLPSAQAYHLVFPFAGGICIARLCRRRPACAVISCGLGGAIGAMVRVCGGVCGELFMYSGLFFLAQSAVCGIITRAKRTYNRER